MDNYWQWSWNGIGSDLSIPDEIANLRSGFELPLVAVVDGRRG